MVDHIQLTLIIHFWIPTSLLLVVGSLQQQRSSRLLLCQKDVGLLIQ
ncbi:unnamed protein product [Paramecium octaurelia]|uniref:Uncharacterized protein n=1 Tax=Paramecium octaurelia TaxID=43137 RepID=A0A8S1UNT6_PAROT|nr:unnamed protein product [Paramecium octaurelia]